MCLLLFENNFFSDEGVLFASKIIFFLSNGFASLRKDLLAVGRIRFAFKIVFLLLNVFTSLRFHIKENVIIEAFVCFCFNIVAITRHAHSFLLVPY
jgi:hypothetical protein